MKHLGARAVNYVCLLSEDGHEFPNSGLILGLSEEEKRDTRNTKPARNRVAGRSAGAGAA